MTNSRVRVELPRKVDDIISLAKAIADKHAELESASPLTRMDWTEFKPAIDVADDAHRAARRLAAQAESALKERDDEMETLNLFLRRALVVLSEKHAGDMRRLEEYGFTVNVPAAVTKKSSGIPWSEREHWLDRHGAVTVR